MKRGMLGVGLLCASAALLALAARFPAFVEHAYARGLYPALSQVLSGASSLVPLSLAEVLVVALVLAIG